MSEHHSSEDVARGTDAILSTYGYKTSDEEQETAQVDALMVLKAAAPAIAARALREAADALPTTTEGANGEGTASWPDQDRATYSLAIEEAQAALRSMADEIERGDA